MNVTPGPCTRVELKIKYSKKWYSSSSTVEPSNPDTLGPESTVLIIEVCSFQGLKMHVLWFIIVDHWVPVVCVHIRGVSPTQGAGLYI